MGNPAEMTPHQAFEKAIAIAGGQSAMAGRLDVKQGHVWYWLNKMGQCPPDRVLDVERATAGAVSRHQLRPDIYPPPAAEGPAPAGTAAAASTLRLTVNGRVREDAVPDNVLLVDYLREKIGLTGTKIGCDGGECGACTVLVDGRPRHSCLTLAHACAGRHVETVEGLVEGGRMAAIQRGFHEKLGAQCGFCTPGMVMAAEGLLRATPDPSTEDIRAAMASNICRCTGYVKIIEAVQAAARELAPREEVAP